MNTLSSLLEWVGNTIGANPNTLTTSSKTIVGSINEVNAKGGVLVVSTSSVSSLPITISDADITANHVCVKAELSNPSAQTADWTVTTSAGSAVISGTSAINGTTDVTLYLASKVN